MFNSLDPLGLIVALGVYVYMGWLSGAVNPRSAKSVGTAALFFWGISALYLVLACVWGTTRGLSPYETLTTNFATFGRFERTVTIAQTFVITAVVFLAATAWVPSSSRVAPMPALAANNRWRGP